MPTFRLRELYEAPESVVVTAHRGFSGQYPENTLLAFEQAVLLGADLLEFDIRGTKDHVPIVLHDETLDRTSDGKGSPNLYTLKELRTFNCSYWQGAHGDGRRLAAPAVAGATIPTLREVLVAFKNRVGFNIQVYESGEPLLSEICRLYDEYDLYEQGYLSMSTFEEAELVRAINPRIELCVLGSQGRMDLAALQKLKAFGCTCIQPWRDEVTPEFCRMVRELGLYANMFYSNTDADNRRYIGYGLKGILTDYPDVLMKTLKDMGLR